MIPSIEDEAVLAESESKICSGSLKSASSIGSNAEFPPKPFATVVFLTSGEAAECLRIIFLPILYFKRVVEVHKIRTSE